MPVIVMASPKGGVGKSTVSVLLATGFARLGADVTIIDTDPNRSLSRWASHGMPPRVNMAEGVKSAEIIRAIRAADGDGRIVIVDLEGIASQLVSRAISQADLVIVPMQPTALDAEIGAEALALVREEEEALGRPIRHAVALTKVNAAIRSRVQAVLERRLEEAGIDIIQPYLVDRSAYSEIFAHGFDLETMAANPELTTIGRIDPAIRNARAFTEAVYARLT